MAKKVSVKIEGKETVSKAAKTAKKGVKDLGQSVKTSTEKMLKSALSIGAVIIAVKKLHKVFNDLEAVYKVQGEAETLFEAALRATGTAATVSAEKIYALAASLQSVTLFGDEATITATALLQSLSSLSQEGLEKIIPLMQDFSTGMKVDLQTAASLVGKTLGSTTNALARYGIVIDATLPKEEKLIALTESLESKFGGMAEALGATAIAAKEQLAFAISDLKEQMGRTIAMGMRPFRESLTEIVVEMVKVKEAANDAAEYMNKLGRQQVTAAESLQYWNFQLAESEKVLGRLWSRMWRGRIIQSEEYIKAKIAEYEIQVKLEEAAALNDKKEAKRLAKELADAKEKAVRIKKLFDIESAALERLKELRLEILSPLERGLKLIQDELDLYSDLKREVVKYGVTWIAIEAVILMLLGKEKKLRAEIASMPLFPALPQAGTPPIAGAAGGGAGAILGPFPVPMREEIESTISAIETMEESLRSALLDTGLNAVYEFSAAFTDIFTRDAENMGEALKNAFKSAIIAGLKAWAAYMSVPGPTFNPWGAVAAMMAAGVVSALGEGGIVTKPTLALIGEKGPEEVRPLRKGGSGNVYITVEGSVLAERELEGIALQGMKRLGRGY